MKKKYKIIFINNKNRNIIRRKRKNKNKYKRKNQKYIINIKIFLFILLLLINYYIEYIFVEFYFNKKDFIFNIKEFKRKHIINPNIKEDITLVSAYFNVKSKFSKEEYLNWIDNFLQINHTMIFFIDNSDYQKIISKRPKKYRNKTIWVKTNIKDFYSYKKFYKNFNQTYKMDVEKNMYSVPVYLVWAEKINFLKIVASRNFFKSKCFYWVDAGCFKDKSKIRKYINDWPSSQKCYEDGRIILNEIISHSQSLKNELTKFNMEIHNNFQRFRNVDTSIFGGQKEYIFKFANLYYKTVKLYIQHGIFIGKERNLFAYIAYIYKDVVKLVYSGYYFYFQEYLSKDYNKSKNNFI